MPSIHERGQAIERRARKLSQRRRQFRFAHRPVHPDKAAVVQLANERGALGSNTTIEKSRVLRTFRGAFGNHIPTRCLAMSNKNSSN
ncbi:hypothetical protein L596_004128 [Steinernema carpocapsae]|uniref:Uncharacterized protein n=1 Tax=Steinernema carpocapsae TaxID=34508 RepID=A0A4U8UYW7_STECR|nr:hypothetical protein L596_004128 [Steinernema carpocapsae]